MHFLSRFLAYLKTIRISYAFSEKLKFALLKNNKTASKNIKGEGHEQSELQPFKELFFSNHKHFIFFSQRVMFLSYKILAENDFTGLLDENTEAATGGVL